jgi:hypothetical protein
MYDDGATSHATPGVLDGQPVCARRTASGATGYTPVPFIRAERSHGARIRVLRVGRLGFER